MQPWAPEPSALPWEHARGQPPSLLLYRVECLHSRCLLRRAPSGAVTQWRFGPQSGIGAIFLTPVAGEGYFRHLVTSLLVRGVFAPLRRAALRHYPLNADSENLQTLHHV